MLLKKNEKPSVIITIALVAAGVIIVSIVFFNRANKGPDRKTSFPRQLRG